MTEHEIKIKANAQNKMSELRDVPNEIKWSAWNHHFVMEKLRNGQGYDFGKIKLKKSKPIFCIGSGPSLDDSIDELKKWKGDIICSSSQFKTFVHLGIIPTYVVVLDMNCQEKEVEIPDWTNINSILIIHLGAKPQILETWKSEYAFYRKHSAAIIFYDNAQKLMYTNQEIYNFESLIPTKVNMWGCAANIQIQMAAMMGYDEIYLAGVDFGWTNSKVRFSAWEYNDGIWAYEENITPKDLHFDTKTKDGVLMDRMMIYYKRNFFTVWRLVELQIISTDKGALYELPYMAIKDIIAGKKIKGFNKAKRQQVAEDYMAKSGIYVMFYRNGINFIETDGVYAMEQTIDTIIKNNLNREKNEYSGRMKTARDANVPNKMLEKMDSEHRAKIRDIKDMILKDKTIKNMKEVIKRNGTKA